MAQTPEEFVKTLPAPEGAWWVAYRPGQLHPGFAFAGTTTYGLHKQYRTLGYVGQDQHGWWVSHRTVGFGIHDERLTVVDGSLGRQPTALECVAVLIASLRLTGDL